MRENGGRERGAEGGGRGKVPLRSGVGVNNEICCDGEAVVSRLSRGNRRASVLVALSSNSGLLDVLFFLILLIRLSVAIQLFLSVFFINFIIYLFFVPRRTVRFFYIPLPLPGSIHIHRPHTRKCIKYH